MMAEREAASELGAIAAERDHGAALPLKIHDKDSHFYPAFLCLSQNFHGKSVLPPSSKVQDRHKEELSQNLVRLLRWDLPQTGIPFSRNDGSAQISEVARYLRVSTDEVKSVGAGLIGAKIRTVVYEKLFQGNREERVAAVGGHGFAVFAPPGHCLIPRPCACCPQDQNNLITPLVHETDKIGQIKKSNFLSSMDRPGGVNFSPQVSGGYRPNANSEIRIDEMQLYNAIRDGLQFFQNRFSGIVYGVGCWDQQKNWWDGKIPLCYANIATRKSTILMH